MRTTPAMAGTVRWAAHKKLRNALCDFAGDSWRANAWAERRYRQLRTYGKRPPTPDASSPAAGAHITWRCWQDHTP